MAGPREDPVSEVIPFDRLGIPEPLRARLGPQTPVQARLAIARGLLPMPPDVQVAVCYALVGDESPDVAQAASDTLIGLPYKQLTNAIGERTHPKILEFLAEYRAEEPDLDARLLRIRALNTRTARLIARRASPTLCEDIARNQERLLLSPEVVLELHANENASDAVLERAVEFLRLEAECPPLPEVRPFRASSPDAPEAQIPEPKPPEPRFLEIDVEAEVAAALSGLPSPALEAQSGAMGGGAFEDRLTMDLGDFRHDYYDEADFDDILTRDFSEQGGPDEKVRKSLVRIIAEMNVTQKIKLAFLGNKEARAILIRDRIKSVPTAVIRSGRLTDGEVVMLASDRNLSRDVIRQLSMSKEYTRKYPVQVALLNNPKTPLSTAMGYLKFLNKRDLVNASRNKNISSALAQAAYKLSKTKES